MRALRITNPVVLFASARKKAGAERSKKKVIQPNTLKVAVSRDCMAFPPGNSYADCGFRGIVGFSHPSFLGLYSLPSATRHVAGVTTVMCKAYFTCRNVKYA